MIIIGVRENQTTIAIMKEDKDALDTLKIHAKEPYCEVISRLIKENSVNLMTKKNDCLRIHG